MIPRRPFVRTALAPAILGGTGTLVCAEQTSPKPKAPFRVLYSNATTDTVS